MIHLITTVCTLPLPAPPSAPASATQATYSKENTPTRFAGICSPLVLLVVHSKMATDASQTPSRPLPCLPESYQRAIQLIDAAHAQDPNLIEGPDGLRTLPYELHYARQMTRWLALHTPSASPILQLACRAQHFKRRANSLAFL